MKDNQSEFSIFNEFDAELEAKRQQQVSKNEDKAAEHAKEISIELNNKSSNSSESQPSDTNTSDTERNAFIDTVNESYDNSLAFDELIDKIRKSSNTARDYGTKFETLIKDWFTRDGAYSDMFTEIHTYSEWAATHPELAINAKDTGIDLVGTNASDGQYSAIQCKMYATDHRVSKADIDSFVSASDKSYFTKRFIVATNESWSDNVKKDLIQKTVPITIISHSELASSNVNWKSYESGRFENLKKRVPRSYQKEAISQTILGFKNHDRGKLIMACGTGKTFTSMKIVEEYPGKGGLVVFLVPSLSLLSQTLTDWKRNCDIHINAFAVCSDSSTGKANSHDVDSLTTVDQLAYPATTDANALVNNVMSSLQHEEDLTVIFSTYQSIQVISDAQGKGLPEIDLIICDEAHRTAGNYFVEDNNESYFTKVHDNSFIKAKKRLYMTATPKIYGNISKEQEKSSDLVLYSMDDESVFGPTFSTVSFTRAIDLGCLVDYKVVVLTLDESLLEKDYDFLSTNNIGGISIKNAGKIVGIWRALSKMDLQSESSISGDFSPMKRAVAFAQVIDPSKDSDKASSKEYADYFNAVIDRYKDREKVFLKKRWGKKFSDEEYDEAHKLQIETMHIDGSMNATEKDSRLTWLRSEPDENKCKILFNVRCLSEGVDVPSLDAVVFLSPRKSQVDIVQTVGRVMRIAPNKKRGYVVLPIVVPTGVSPDLVLNRNKDFDVVWQTLNGLKSIDSSFSRAVDGELEKINSDRIEIISISDKKFSHKKGADSESSVTKRGKSKKSFEKSTDVDTDNDTYQTGFDFERDEFLEEEIRSRIIKRVGNRKEWSDWAEEVGEICQTQIKHINKIVNENASSKKALDKFTEELKATLNGNITQDAVIEMLGQHVVIKPVLQALFKEYPFAEQNPISKALTEMLDKLDKKGMKRCTELLEPFYGDVNRRMESATDAETRQTIIKDMFDKFFKTAFPKMRDKLGIVYTPVEIVDFINHSVADLLDKEFGLNIGEPNVHILDPFTGTGTFIVRLLQSGLIKPEDLKYKYENEIHAHEIVPLAYYIAAMNIETAYHELCEDEEYKPNDILVWTDTFANNEESDLFKTSLADNNKNLSRENLEDVRVIIGNPPYSVGQESQNDDNANEHYEQLDARLKETYVDRSSATLKGALFDSYIRAYRWASDRIGASGVIGFVTNAGWLESASADGMRKCMADEFSSIYIYHLKGNARTSGEQRRKEKDNIFGEGSRAPVAMVFLVKNPNDPIKGKIFFHSVEDYLTREQKLNEVSKFGSISNKAMSWERIIPDKHGDWLNQKDDSFQKYLPIFDKDGENCIFNANSVGVCTNRDTWVYNSSKADLENNLSRTVKAYNEAIDRVIAGEDVQKVISETKDDISWTAGSKTKFKLLQKQSVDSNNELCSLYRPFFKQVLYYDKNPIFVERPSRWKEVFPNESLKNLVISVTGVGNKEFSCLLSSTYNDYQTLFNSQNFPRFIYSSDGVQFDAITDSSLKHFQQPYGNDGISINKNDLFYYIYGILHSPEYREKYANNLSKELPRIPRVASFEQFCAFKDAGRKLANLHVNYEKQPEYKGVSITGDESGNWHVTQMKWGKIPGKTGNAAKDKTVLIYNDKITIKNIPLEAQEYVVNKKSALDWVVERACVSTDKKTGITNDFNLYGIEQGNERYPLALFLKVLTVSLETLKIIRSLPKLEIHELDQDNS